MRKHFCPLLSVGMDPNYSVVISNDDRIAEENAGSKELERLKSLNKSLYSQLIERKVNSVME